MDLLDKDKTFGYFERVARCISTCFHSSVLVTSESELTFQQATIRSYSRPLGKRLLRHHETEVFLKAQGPRIQMLSMLGIVHAPNISRIAWLLW